MQKILLSTLRYVGTGLDWLPPSSHVEQLSSAARGQRTKPYAARLSLEAENSFVNDWFGRDWAGLAAPEQLRTAALH